MDSLILIANPGSASRKYAVYSESDCLIKLHFEIDKGEVVYTVEKDGKIQGQKAAGISHLTFAAARVVEILDGQELPEAKNRIKTVALRLVAPSGYFQQDRRLDDEAIRNLTDLQPRAPLHIGITLQEINVLKSSFTSASFVAISDSAFHSTMPEHAAHYALPASQAAKFEIKRYGYHGLSNEHAVGTLKEAGKLPKRLVICHLGSGASVTALEHGKSLDTSMGYSPLEGLMMATRSGSIDTTAAQALQAGLKIDSQELQELLNERSGLLGVSGHSSDVRTLLELEKNGDSKAGLALRMYIYRASQAVGQMAASLGGIDVLVFSGTVAERSAEIRKRLVHRLNFLGLELDTRANHEYEPSELIKRLSPASRPARVYVIPADENTIMVSRARFLED